MVAVSSEAELAAKYGVYVTESGTDDSTPLVFGGVIFKQGLDDLGENFDYVIRFGADQWQVRHYISPVFCEYNTFDE